MMHGNMSSFYGPDQPRNEGVRLSTFAPSTAPTRGLFDFDGRGARELSIVEDDYGMKVDAEPSQKCPLAPQGKAGSTAGPSTSQSPVEEINRKNLVSMGKAGSTAGPATSQSPVEEIKRRNLVGKGKAGSVTGSSVSQSPVAETGKGNKKSPSCEEPCSSVPNRSSPTQMDAWFEIYRWDANKRLMMMGNPSGTYLIRPSSDLENFAISVRCLDTDHNIWFVKHYLVRLTKNGDYQLSKSVIKPSMLDVIRHCKANHYLCCRLTMACPKKDRLPVHFRDLEVNRQSINKICEIGAGSFGEVWYAVWSKAVQVAVKTLKPGTMEPKHFIQEAKLLHEMHHPRILQVLGVCTKEEPIYIITEYMRNGSLLDYLRYDQGQSLAFNDLVSMMLQIIEGMVFLESKQLIHRDLRAANILVDENNQVKVSDFSLTVLTKYGVFCGFEQVKSPIRWTAPEGMAFKRFSLKSDVWAFGIMIYEMVTFGQTPYKDMDNQTVKKEVQNGYRIPNPSPDYPEYCSDELYDIMLQCWNANYKKRPTFSHLFEVFKNWSNPT